MCNIFAAGMHEQEDATSWRHLVFNMHITALLTPSDNTTNSRAWRRRFAVFDQ